MTFFKALQNILEFVLRDLCNEALLKSHFQYQSYLTTFYSLETLGSHCKTHAKNLNAQNNQQIKITRELWQLNKPKINSMALSTTYWMPSLYLAFYTCSHLVFTTILWQSDHCSIFTDDVIQVQRRHTICPLPCLLNSRSRFKYRSASKMTPKSVCSAYVTLWDTNTTFNNITLWKLSYRKYLRINNTNPPPSKTKK